MTGEVPADGEGAAPCDDQRPGPVHDVILPRRGDACQASIDGPRFRLTQHGREGEGVDFGSRRPGESAKVCRNSGRGSGI